MAEEDLPPLSPDERAELDRLRAAEATPKPVERHRTRSLLALVLLTLAAILTPITVAAVWLHSEVGSTDRYVSTVAPLADDPNIQAGVTNRVTDVIVQELNLQGLANDAQSALSQLLANNPRLESLTSSLADPIVSGATSFIHSAVQRVVQSSAFATLWAEVNRAAHKTVVDTLSSSKGVVGSGNGEISINLGPIVERVKTQLVDDGFKLADKIPAVTTNYVIAQSSSLDKARKAFHLLDVLGNWLPFIVLVLFAGGVLLAVRKRRALIYGGLAVAITSALVGIALWIFRHYYKTHLPADVNQAAALVFYDTVIRFLRTTVRTASLVALFVALGAYFTGPAAFATRIRVLCKALIGRLRALTQQVGLATGPVGPWVRGRRRRLAAGATAVALVVLFFWSYPTGWVVFWLAVALLVVLAVLEFLDPGTDTPPRKTEPAPAPATT